MSMNPFKTENIPSVGESSKAIESGETKETREAQAALEHAQSVVLSIERSNIAPEVKAQLNSRVMRATKKIIQGATLATVVGIIGLAANHEVAHETAYVTETKDEDGKAIFSHSDPATTHVLNYLTGKESLSDEERSDFMHDSLSGILKTIPPNFEQMGTQELAEFADSHGIADAGILLFIWRHIDPEKYKFDQKVYEQIWQVEKQVGAPRVHWAHRSKINSSRRTIYDPLTHTISILPLQPHERLYAELAHSKQWSKSPVRAYLMFAEALVRTGSRFIASLGKQDLFDSYSVEYSLPGSLEHEAHEIIQPEIIKQAGPNPKPAEDKRF